MATCTGLARHAHYFHKFGKASLIFLKKGLWLMCRVWRVLKKCASFPSNRKKWKKGFLANASTRRNWEKTVEYWDSLNLRTSGHCLLFNSNSILRMTLFCLIKLFLSICRITFQQFHFCLLLKRTQ
jgi:hypothetical protein